jgi:hypothetical protein
MAMLSIIPDFSDLRVSSQRLRESKVLPGQKFPGPGKPLLVLLFFNSPKKHGIMNLPGTLSPLLWHPGMHDDYPHSNPVIAMPCPPGIGSERRGESSQKKSTVSGYFRLLQSGLIPARVYIVENLL